MAATILLNGKPIAADAGCATVGALLAVRSIDPAHVVVEVNREIIDRADFDARALRDGDTVEILRFVGGG
jgi:thiamine biosynthesis protein ThiS